MGPLDQRLDGLSWRELVMVIAYRIVMWTMYDFLTLRSSSIFTLCSLVDVDLLRSYG